VLVAKTIERINYYANHVDIPEDLNPDSIQRCRYFLNQLGMLCLLMAFPSFFFSVRSVKSCLFFLFVCFFFSHFYLLY
jgi:hypothetical protein